MNESVIAVRYGKALYAFASEEKQLETVKKDVELIMNCINTMDDFKAFILNPIINHSQKKQVIKEIFKDKLHPSTLSFITLLTVNKREIFLADIIRYFLKLYNAQKGIKLASIKTAYKIDDELKKLIIKLIKKKFNTSVELEHTVNPALIGGFILRIEDQQIDASISGGLAKIKKELLNSE